MDRQKNLIAGISGSVIIGAILMIALTSNSLHKIDEGNVGIYFVRGALENTYTLPGVHWSVPFVTRIEEITIRPQTVKLEPIKTVTRDGIDNHFYNIQVLFNVDVEQLVALIKKFGMHFQRTLVHDRIAEELRTFCANHTIDEVGF